MKKVLVVSYFYPPFDTTAALEASRLTRDLPHLGWTPLILTAENDYLPTLPLEVPSELVHRTKQVDVNRLPKRVLQRNKGAYSAHVGGAADVKARVASALGRVYRQVVNVPDGQIGWLPYAVKAGRELVQRHRPDLILSIGGPFTDHLVAHRLTRNGAVPWFADFRDLWTDNHFFTRVEPLMSLERSLENTTIGTADALSTATPQWAELLKKRFSKPTWVIPNGFDQVAQPETPPPSHRFVLTYTGVYYSRGQNMTPLLEALSDLQKDGLISEADFELRLIGRFLESVASDVHRLGLEGMVSFRDPIPHEEALKVQRTSTALLFLLWSSTPTGRGWLSAKVYEYMAAARPILALGPPDGDAAELVTSLRAGEVADGRTATADVLRRWIGEFRRAGTLEVHTDREGLKRYEWSSIARQLVSAFDDTVQRHSEQR